MRTYSTAILIVAWLILGFGLVLDQADASDFNSPPLAVIAQDNDDDAKTKIGSIETATFSASLDLRWPAIRSVEQPPLATSSTLRYQLLSVYRL